MDEYVRYKRKNGSVYTWGAKLYTPVLKETKAEFDRVARRYRMSQAELGAVIVMHYLENRILSVVAVREYKNTTRKIRKEKERKRDEGKSSGTTPRVFNGGRFGDPDIDAWFEGLDD